MLGSREEERVSSCGSVLLLKKCIIENIRVCVCVCVMMMMIRASLLAQMVKNLPAMQETCI